MCAEDLARPAVTGQQAGVAAFGLQTEHPQAAATVGDAGLVADVFIIELAGDDALARADGQWPGAHVVEIPAAGFSGAQHRSDAEAQGG